MAVYTTPLRENRRVRSMLPSFSSGSRPVPIRIRDGVSDLLCHGLPGREGECGCDQGRGCDGQAHRGECEWEEGRKFTRRSDLNVRRGSGCACAVCSGWGGEGVMMVERMDVRPRGRAVCVDCLLAAASAL